MPEPRFFALSPERQQNIVTAAQQEFGQKGYQAGSTNHIVKACGISKGSLFNYFRDKDDVYMYSLRKAHEEIIARIEAEACPHQELMERFAYWARRVFLMLKARPDVYLLFQGLAQAPPAIQTRYAQENAAFFERTRRFWLLPEGSSEKLQVLLWCHTGLSQDIQLRAREGVALDELERYFEERLQLLLRVFKSL